MHAAKTVNLVTLAWRGEDQGLIGFKRSRATS